MLLEFHSKFQYEQSDLSRYPYCRYSIDDPKYEFFYTMTGEDSERFIRTAAHPLELTFNSCKIFGKITTCSDVFDVVPTNAGINCCETSVSTMCQFSTKI